MGSVVALDQYRESITKKDHGVSRPARPEISGGEIWGRDYREVEAIVFGLLKVRAILAHHMGGFNHVFDQLSMDCLEAAYNIHEVGPARLRLAVKPLKEWILDEMNDENRRDLSWSLVILDLIEKSPTK